RGLDVDRVTAGTGVVHRVAADLVAVRTQHPEGEGAVAPGRAVGPSGERHRVHRLAGAIDAALGEDVGVDGAGRLATGHAPVAEVERRIGEAEEGELAAVF